MNVTNRLVPRIILLAVSKETNIKREAEKGRSGFLQCINRRAPPAEMTERAVPEPLVFKTSKIADTSSKGTLTSF